MCLRVLIADSDRALLERYRQHLERDGFAVTTATSGLECVDKLRQERPDLLVLEPSLPWGWGDGVLAVMDEDPTLPPVPVMVLTHGRDRSLLYRLASFRIDDFLIKPVSSDRLALRLKTMAVRNLVVATPRV